jgi:outer membrane lipopolysaccharide assembly protein LptE/RlpB
VRAALPLSAAILALGCAYSVRGNLPAHIQSVQVERFRSTATEYGLDQELTASVTERLVEDGRLTVVTSTPDARLSGTITSFDRSAYSYTSSETVEEYRLLISVSAELMDLATDEKILDEQIREWITYSPDEESFADAKARLLEIAAEEVARAALSGW